MLRVFILKLFVFAAIMCAIIGAVNRYISPRLCENNVQWRELFNETVKPNVVVIGASHAASGINPEFLESPSVTVYNFSTPGNSPAATLKWYVRLFRKYHSKPKLVIYEVNWFMFDEDWLSLKYENLSHYLPLRIFANELVAGDNNVEMLLLNRYPLFYANVRDVIFKKTGCKDTEPAYCYNGFTYNDDKPFKLDEKRHVSTRIFEKQQEAFTKVLDTLNADGMKIVFVQAPEYLAGRSSPVIGKHNDLIRRIAQERGIPFLNFNEELQSAINKDKGCYSDWGHLNRRGSMEFSRLLRAELVKRHAFDSLQ